MTTTNGKLDLDSLDFKELVPKGTSDAKVEEIRKKVLSFADSYDQEVVKHVAPAGHFGLPKLLDERRLEWQIPDGAFLCSPGTLYDRILLYQIPLLARTKSDGKFIGGSKGFLVASAQTQDKQQREAPRGIIIGAGLKALDSLRAHGVDIGHIVYFAKNTVYSILVDQIAGHEERVSLAREGDLILDEDLAKALREGKAKLAQHRVTNPDGLIELVHVYEDAEGNRYNPVLPEPEDDF